MIVELLEVLVHDSRVIGAPPLSPLPPAIPLPRNSGEDLDSSLWWVPQTVLFGQSFAKSENGLPLPGIYVLVHDCRVIGGVSTLIVGL